MQSFIYLSLLSDDISGFFCLENLKSIATISPRIAFDLYSYMIYTFNTPP